MRNLFRNRVVTVTDYWCNRLIAPVANTKAEVGISAVARGVPCGPWLSSGHAPGAELATTANTVWAHKNYAIHSIAKQPYQQLASLPPDMRVRRSLFSVDFRLVANDLQGHTCANLLHQGTDSIWLADCAYRFSSRPLPHSDDSRPPAGNTHKKIYFAGFRLFLGRGVFRILVGTGCRHGLWADCDH